MIENIYAFSLWYRPSEEITVLHYMCDGQVPLTVSQNRKKSIAPQSGKVTRSIMEKFLDSKFWRRLSDSYLIIPEHTDFFRQLANV